MYVSATDPEKLGQVTASVYTSSTEELLAFLLFMYAEIRCFVSVFSSLLLYLFGTLLEYLKGHCNQKNYFLSIWSFG